MTSNPREIVDGEQKYRNYIYAYSIDPGGEDFVILDEERTFSIATRTQLYGNSMYIFVVDQLKDDGDAKLLRWDVETHELETLFDDKATFTPGEDFWVTEEGVFMDGTSFDDPVTDDEGNSVWERNVYFYDFSTEEFEVAFPTTGTGLVRYGFSDGLFTVRTNWEKAFDITVYDFNGQTVFAGTFDASILPDYSVTPLCFAGADENNLYLYSIGRLYLVCIPIDGGEPIVLHGNWTWD